MGDTITITINISGLRAALDALLPGAPVAARVATPTVIDAMPEASAPPETDIDGVVWDAALHAADKRLTRDGRWARKRGRPAAGGACVVEPHAPVEPTALEDAHAVGDPVPNAAEASIGDLTGSIGRAIVSGVDGDAIRSAMRTAIAVSGADYDGQIDFDDDGIAAFSAANLAAARGIAAAILNEMAQAHCTAEPTATFDELDDAVRGSILAGVPIQVIHDTFNHAAAAAGCEYDGSGILFFAGDGMGRARAMICAELASKSWGNDAERRGDENG